MIVKQLNRLNYGDKSPSKAQPTVSRNNAKVTRLARKSTPLKSALLRRKQELEESLDKSTYAKIISRDQTLIPSVPRSGAATIDGDDGALGLPTSRPSTAHHRHLRLIFIKIRGPKMAIIRPLFSTPRRLFSHDFSESMARGTFARV